MPISWLSRETAAPAVSFGHSIGMKIRSLLPPARPLRLSGSLPGKCCRPLMVAVVGSLSGLEQLQPLPLRACWDSATVLLSVGLSVWQTCLQILPRSRFALPGSSTWISDSHCCTTVVFVSENKIPAAVQKALEWSMASLWFHYSLPKYVVGSLELLAFLC